MLSLLALSSGSFKPPHYQPPSGAGNSHPVAAPSVAISSAGSGNGMLSSGGPGDEQRPVRVAGGSLPLMGGRGPGDVAPMAAGAATALGSLPLPLPPVAQPPPEDESGSGRKSSGLRPYSSLPQPRRPASGGSLLAGGGSNTSSGSHAVAAGLQTPFPASGSSITVTGAVAVGVQQPPCEEEEGGEMSAAFVVPDPHSHIQEEEEAGVELPGAGPSADVDNATANVRPAEGVNDTSASVDPSAGVDGGPVGGAVQPLSDDEPDCWHEVVIKAMVHPVDGR